ESTPRRPLARAVGRLLALLVFSTALGACTSSAPGEEQGSNANAFSTQRHGVGACELLHQQRASLALQTRSDCEPISPFVEATIRECAILWNTAPTAVCAYSAPLDTGCGPTLSRNAGFCVPDDTLALDQPFVLEKVSTQGDFAAATMLAHEWGHLNQQRMGLGISETRIHLANELHADCHAGVFTAVQQLQGHLDLGDAEEAFNSFCRAGDPATAPFNPDGHGTCADRTTAFLTGYEGARADPDTVCSESALEATVAICARY
ncbi:MAG: uncharacterized protein QOI41_7834, partial [Myxococcales bacterium]|nr:uncharacterized protein [Myxococcales bacterium]